MTDIENGRYILYLSVKIAVRILSLMFDRKKRRGERMSKEEKSLSVDARHSIYMLDMCVIWAENSEDGVGYWEEPMPEEEHWDFMFSVTDGEGNEIYDYYEDAHEYLIELLRPLFPNLRG